MLIVRAAIMFSNGEVLEGHSYGGISTTAQKLSMSGDKIYGFTTSMGDFVLPNEAAKIAVEANQVTEREELKPEDLWSSFVLE